MLQFSQKLIQCELPFFCIDKCTAVLFTCTVTIRKPDRPDFEWSFSGRFLSLVFECFGGHFAFENRTGLFKSLAYTVLS